MKTIITPLGFDTSQILSFIAKDGIGKGDRIIILRPEEDEGEMRGQKAFHDMRNIVARISQDIEMEKIVLDTKDFPGMIREISSLLVEAKDEVVVNLSGGVRSVLVALTVCSVFFNQKISRTYNFEELEREMVRIELPYVFFDLTKNEKRMIKALMKGGPMFYRELTEELDLSKSTISRLSAVLEDMRAVRLEEVGKEIRVHLSITGELMNRILEQDSE